MSHLSSRQHPARFLKLTIVPGPGASERRDNRLQKGGGGELGIKTNGRYIQLVAQRHQMVSTSLALLFIGLELPLGSRAAAPKGEEVL